MENRKKFILEDENIQPDEVIEETKDMKSINISD